MSVYLTSFNKSEKINGKKYSIVKYQPKGFNYEELLFFAPIGPLNDEIRSRDFFGTGKNFPKDDAYTVAIKNYESQIKAGYKARWNEIWFWLMSLRENEDIILCCWCPYSKSSQESIKHTGKFHCHSSLIKKLIVEFRPDITIVEDEDRSNDLHSWR